MASATFVVNTFSYIWRQRAGEAIAALAGRGWREFEVLLSAPHLWPAEAHAEARRGLAREVERAGAAIVGLNAGGFDNNLASPAADVRGHARRYLEEAIDLAADVGATYVVMSPGIGRPLLPPPAALLLEWFLEGMEPLVERAERRQVRLLVENIPFAFLPTADALVAGLAGLPVERVGIVYDVANAVYAREDPVAGLAKVAPRLALLHVSDTPLASWQHGAVGTGVVPFADIARALRVLASPAPRVLEIVTRDPDSDIAASARALEVLGW